MKGEYIVNATVVLPSGKVLKTRSRARKSAMGWDTTKLFIGAEGYVQFIKIRIPDVLSPYPQDIGHRHRMHSALSAEAANQSSDDILPYG